MLNVKMIHHRPEWLLLLSFSYHNILEILQKTFITPQLLEIRRYVQKNGIKYKKTKVFRYDFAPLVNRN